MTRQKSAFWIGLPAGACTLLMTWYYMLNLSTDNPKDRLHKDVTNEEDLIFPEDIPFLVVNLRVRRPRSGVKFMGIVLSKSKAEVQQTHEPCSSVSPQDADPCPSTEGSSEFPMWDVQPMKAHAKKT